MCAVKLAQMVGCHPLTSEVHVQFQASSRGICGGKVTLGHVWLQVLQFHSTALSVPFHWCSILILACHWCYIISTTMLKYTLKSCVVSSCKWWHVISVYCEAPYILSRITVAIENCYLKVSGWTLLPHVVHKSCFHVCLNSQSAGTSRKMVWCYGLCWENVCDRWQ